MKTSVIYVLFGLLIPSVYFGQDILVGNDSSRQEVKVIEINLAEIKFKRFNYLEGPLFILNKKDVSYVIYQNGTKEIFKIFPEPGTTKKSDTSDVFVNAIPPNESNERVPKLGDYIKFNLEVGAVLNNAYCNKPYDDNIYHGHYAASESYSPIVNAGIKAGFNAGINFLFGKSPFCKHIIGLNYLQSRSEFNFHYSDADYYKGHELKSTYEKNANYKTTAHFLNLVTGIRFTFFKKINLDNCLAVNIPVYTINRVTGTLVTSEYDINYNTYGTNFPLLTNSMTTNINNELSHESKVEATFSFLPRLSYDLMIKEQKFAIYTSYNISYKYKLPCYMFGVTWYPFKKLR